MCVYYIGKKQLYQKIAESNIIWEVYKNYFDLLYKDV